VTTSNGGEIASRRGKRTDDARWAYRDLIVPKNEKKIHTVDSSVTNER
jgi:hypothetical protein